MPAKRKYLKDFYPHVLADWDRVRNPGVDPRELFVTSKGNYWWKCNLGHAFAQQIVKRVRGNQCHVCAGFIVEGQNDFFTLNPQFEPWLILEPGETVPRQLSNHDRGKRRWRCPLKHPEFEASPRQMTYNRGDSKSPCMVCRKRVRVEGKSLFNGGVEDLSHWAWDLNDYGPEHYSWGNSTDELYWMCDEGHPPFRATPYDKRTRQRICPACPGSHKVVQGINDLATSHPRIAERWDFDNNLQKPEELKIGSVIKVVLHCSLDERHKTPMMLPNLKGNQEACSDCWRNPLVEGENDLNTLGFDFISEWDEEANQLEFQIDSPKQVKWTDERRLNWNCKEFGHSFKMAPYYRVSRGSSCTVCSNRQIIPGFNDLATSHPEIASEWSLALNGDLTASQVSAKSGKDIYWNCEKGHEPFRSPPWNRTQAETGCPECSEFGFRESIPAILYLVERSDSSYGRRARKIGITNAPKGYRRLSVWRRQGFHVVQTWTSESGALIRKVEGSLKNWLTSDTSDFPYLDADEMPFGGHTETLPYESPTNFELVSLIESLIQQAEPSS